jgi:hypothetical protein
VRPRGGGRRRGLTRRAFLQRGLSAGAGLSLLPWLARPAGAASVPAAGAVAAPAAVASANGLVELPSAVFGGECQYFRMSPSAIPARLALCREAAFTVVQTYVPWNVHEYIPGRFDFEGRTHPNLPDDHLDEYQEQTPDQELETGGIDGRAGLLCNTDLVGYLSECQRLGLRVILRPGPFISDEWRNGGLPDWFLDLAPPDMYMYGPDGTPLTPGAPNGSYPEANVTGGQTLFYFPSPSYASPHYLAGARRWLAAFAEFVAPWLVSNGGPVIALQVDDETCFFYRFGPFEVDYNPATLAQFGRASGLQAPRAWPPSGEDVSQLRPALAWQAFKGSQVAGYLATLRDDLRAAGVRVPITHEIELSLAPPADIADDAGAVLVNSEIYPGGSGPEVMPLIELTAGAVRAAQRHRLNPWAAEMESDTLKFDLLIGEGIIGGIPFNYTDGIADGDVAERGRLGRTLAAAGPRLTRARRRADVAIVWDNSLTRLPYDSQRWGLGVDVRRVIEQHVPALATLLLRAGLAFDLLDVEAAAPEDFDPGAYRAIFLAAAEILPRAAQLSLIAYVRRGGRLVCWPAPPTLDERLEPCTALAEALYPERPRALYPDDAQQIRLLGRTVTTWRGVQTYALSAHATAIATREGMPCGYSRRFGRGRALLLGTWLAADCVPGRAGAVLASQQLPAGASEPQVIAAARALVAEHLGAQGAALVPEALPGGPAQELLIYDYSNERRGGEVISGGALAYWDGANVVGMLELNTTASGLGFTQVPYHPIEPAHLAAVRELAALTPHVSSSEARVQARLLEGPARGTATVMAANRWYGDLRTVLRVKADGRRLRLPSRGTLALPAATGILMPIGYELGHGVRILAATAQLTGFEASAEGSVLELWSPAGGEAIVELPGAPGAATLDGRPLALARRGARTLRAAIPAGDHTLRLGWARRRSRRR